MWVRKSGIAVGSSVSVRCRPRSSAEPLVYSSENSGSPVTMKSVSVHTSGPSAASAA